MLHPENPFGAPQPLFTVLDSTTYFLYLGCVTLFYILIYNKKNCNCTMLTKLVILGFISPPLDIAPNNFGSHYSGEFIEANADKVSCLKCTNELGVELQTFGLNEQCLDHFAILLLVSCCLLYVQTYELISCIYLLFWHFILMNVAVMLQSATSSTMHIRGY